ncbi:MAG: NADP-dependent phosphogluconate dehydrogenase [Propionibacteriaceae bacterium]|nr:NADP-dependent phosphogluconate dehydrogenase [Micropruina sp.]HBX82912.1 phosphogluconate dehydrogenase (NADP(+)-dependent, decarboxylating) [Propionibacteriaceae bacterium]HBY24475.1 phosphogluconate dehydrogenase (NADP(+)-dependent, decarboxylating) [Propionibacteriaceae bacterium]
MSELTGTAQIGVVGMAVMGSNLARNFASKGFRTAIYNRTYAKTAEVLAEHPEAGFIASETVEEFVNSLERPRRVIMMVKAGAPTDATIDALIPFLEQGDIVIDGGNTYFRDTRVREKKLADLGLNFIGCGISGGEEGALKGPAMMPGGPKDSYAHVAPMLEKVSAQFNGEPCCAWIGPDGAGHFVKMVHNGIEYADMEFIGEAYELLKGVGVTPAEAADIFAEWNTGDLDSYLIEITSEVLRQVDAETGKPLVDLIVDAAGMKGTGTWTVQESMNLGVPTSVIAESVYARATSSSPELRAHSAVLEGPNPAGGIKVDKATFIKQIAEALWCAKVVAYAQGLDLIRVASEEYGWDIDVATCARIWRAGCIIRAKLLDRISNEYAANSLITLLEAPSIQAELARSQESWRTVVIEATRAGVPIPGFAAALSYYDLVRAPRTNAALTQGLRDFFGSHTYRRIDKPGVFHTIWSGDRSEIESVDAH